MALKTFLFKKFYFHELIINRKYSKKVLDAKNNYFLTVPIFYVNADPHLGHLYTATIGDAQARYQKLKNKNVKYMVGTDEHGLKVFKSANASNTDVKSFCDDISQKYKTLFKLCHIEFDDFVRTTEERHMQTAKYLWNKIASKDLIYKSEYYGWYCTSDELFVSDHELEPSNDSSVRYTLNEKKPVHYVTEINYKFKLSKFQKDLLYWLRQGQVIKPKVFQTILEKWIVDGNVLADLSISRPWERVSWGIPVPGDPSQSMYVWFDALSSYLTTSGYPNWNSMWPPTLQIIGKDILRFHGIFWPAFLMAADLEPPKHILCHSHWLKNYQKISKSTGNVIDPFDLVSKFTGDGIRYFLLKEGVPHSDGNYTNEKVIAMLNADLANNLGNLLNRCTSSVINSCQVFPSFIEIKYQSFYTEYSENVMNALRNLPEVVDTHFKEFNIYKALDEIIATLALTNKFFDSEKPWELTKKLDKVDRLNFVIHLTMESLRVCGILLQPVVPTIAENLLNRLSISKNNRNLQNIKPFSWETPESLSNSSPLSAKVTLFNRIKVVG